MHWALCNAGYQPTFESSTNAASYSALSATAEIVSFLESMKTHLHTPDMGFGHTTHASTTTCGVPCYKSYPNQHAVSPREHVRLLTCTMNLFI